jgi:hypothetical protein
MILTDKKIKLIENTAAIKTVIKNFSVNNELLTESDINFFKTVTSSVEQGKEISLNESEIEIYKAFKANVALFEGTLSEETKTLLNEGFSSWFEYFFKGYSEEEGEALITRIDSIKTVEEAKALKTKIFDVLNKIRNKGDSTHTLGNWIMLFNPMNFGALGLLIKHGIKNGLYEGDERKNVEAGLRNSISLIDKKIEELEKKK